MKVQIQFHDESRIGIWFLAARIEIRFLKIGSVPGFSTGLDPDQIHKEFLLKIGCRSSLFTESYTLFYLTLGFSRIST